MPSKPTRRAAAPAAGGGAGAGGGGGRGPAAARPQMPNRVDVAPTAPMGKRAPSRPPFVWATVADSCLLCYSIKSPALSNRQLSEAGFRG